MSSDVSRRALVTVALATATALLAVHLDAQRVERGAAGAPARFYADDPIWVDDDTRDIPPVASFELSKSYEFVNETFGDSVGSRGPALNVNTLGEVPDSSWFTNRIGRSDMTLDQIVLGPNRNSGPAEGRWLVTGRPDSGITPKFTIRDSRGDTYLIKLDPADFPELPSSVEVIATKIFHAIGYHVPEDFIVSFDVDQLDVAPGATIRTQVGSRRPIARADVERWVRSTPRTADGRIRALASRYVPGRVVGQFRYTGTRPDDPNDIYPHERRRELRGLKVFAAWLNHDDARSINSIDTYVEEHGRRYIRHYLQDFGSVLGSGSTSAQQPRGGYEYLVDGGKAAKGLLTLGFWTRDWTTVRYPRDVSLGNIEADHFEPWKWKTEYPQPAFDQMDAVDAFWAARIAARFSDETLAAIVATGRLSNPDAARYLTEVLIRRRDKVVAYWITQTNPLDGLAVRSTPEGAVLTFENAAIRAGAAAGSTSYVVTWQALDNTTGALHDVASSALASRETAVPAAAWGPRDASGIRYAVAAIATVHDQFPHWAQPVRVTLRERAGVVDVVGIDRPTAPERTAGLVSNTRSAK
jgi:hypothetical protein